jgi:hypothetical protein
MIRDNSKRNIRNKKNESVEDPHELLLSLVDLGSLDAEEALLACVTEMSDAECKRVLGSLSLPNNAEDEEIDAEIDDVGDMDDVDMEFPSDEDDSEEDEAEETGEDEADDSDEDVEAELEARIRRLERSLSNESRRRFDRR